jgi:hypothetical protein
VYLLSCAGGKSASGPGDGEMPSYSGSKPFFASLQNWPDAYRQNFARIQSFTGNARLSVESEQMNGNASLDTYWIYPDKLYLLIEGPLGMDVGKIYVGPSRFIWYNQYENHFTSGSVEDPYLNRFMHTNITFQDIKYTSLGYVAMAGEPLRLVDNVHGIFANRKDDIEYHYLVNPLNGLLESCEARRDGRAFMKQEFKNYRIIDGIYIPMLIQITMIDQKERISIFYKQIQLNQSIDTQKLTIEISPKVEQLNAY